MAEAQAAALRGRQQVALGEPPARALDVSSRPLLGERVDRVRVAAVSGDRGKCERRPVARIERVEPRGEQRMERGREGARRGLLTDVGDELLEEQGVAAGRGDDALGARRARQVGDQRPAGGGGERGQDELRAEARPCGVLVRARRPHEEDRRVPQPPEHVQQQVEQRWTGAVRVVDDERQRAPPCERAEEVPERPHEAPAGGGVAQPDGRGRTQHRGRRDAERRGERLPRPVAARLRDRLPQRPERDRGALRGAVAGEHGARVAGDRAELAHEARLADPRLTEHREDLGRALAGDARERRPQQRDLHFPADERTVEAAADGRRVRVDPLQPPVAAAQAGAADAVADDAPGGVREPHLAWLGGPPDPFGGGERVADDQRVGARRDDLARAGPAPHAEPERQLVRGGQLRRRADGALRVVLTRRGDPEHGEDGVAAQLDDTAAMAVAGAPGDAVEAIGRRAQRLGIDAGPGRLGEHAGDPTPGIGRRLGVRRSRRRQVLAQDRRLELAEPGRRLHPEPVHERAACGAVGGERVRLAARVVERGHLQAAQALVERVLRDQRVELARDVRVAAARQLRLEAVTEAGEAQLLEPRDLGLGEARAAHVRERGAAPEPQRVAQDRGRRGGVAARQLGASAPRVRGEAVGVEPARRHAQRVAAALVHDEVVAERGAQPRGQHLHRTARMLRAVLFPQLVHHPVHVDRGAVAGEQQGEERERTPPRHLGPAPARQLDLDRAQDAEPRVHSARAYPGSGAQKAIRNRHL